MANMTESTVNQRIAEIVQQHRYDIEQLQPAEAFGKATAAIAKLLAQEVEYAKTQERERLTLLKIDSELLESEAGKILFRFRTNDCGVEHQCVYSSDNEHFSVAIDGQNVISRQASKGADQTRQKGEI